MLWELANLAEDPVAELSRRSPELLARISEHYPKEELATRVRGLIKPMSDEQDLLNDVLFTAAQNTTVYFHSLRGTHMEMIAKHHQGDHSACPSCVCE